MLSLPQNTHPHTWYLSPSSPICRWRKNRSCGEISDFNTWNFSTWRGISVFPHNRCGEMWNFAKFGGISHFSTWQMWRNMKFTLFSVVKSVLLRFTLFFMKSVLALFTLFCVEKNWAKNLVGGEKMTNIRYLCSSSHLPSTWIRTLWFGDNLVNGNECEVDVIKLSAFTMGGRLMLVFVARVVSSSVGGGSMGHSWYLFESPSLA